MMIKEKELESVRDTYKYQDGEQWTLNNIRKALSKSANEKQLPIAFRVDEVGSGSIMNAGLSSLGLAKSDLRECLIVYHPEHEKDYFNYCIQVRKTGTYAFVQVDAFGKSKQVSKDTYAKSYKEDRVGRPLSYRVGSLIGQGIMTIGKNKSKLQEELMYYSAINDVFDEVIC